MTKIFIIFLFLLSILIKEELSFEVLSKYGKTKTHDSSIFLDVSDFELDDNIYISITNIKCIHWIKNYIIIFMIVLI